MLCENSFINQSHRASRFMPKRNTFVHCTQAQVLAAVSKRHQGKNKVLIFFYPHYIQEIDVYKKAQSCNKPTKLDAIISAECVLSMIHLLYMHVCFIQHTIIYVRQGCLVNNFSDFMNVWVKKKSKISFSLDGVSLQQDAS